MSVDEEKAGTLDFRLETPQQRYIDRRKKDFILKLVAPRRGERLLDVGCGDGEHLRLFQNAGCDVTGIDSSAPLLEVAQQKLGHKAELYRGQAEHLPFSDNEFDIVSLISLELTDDPERALSEVIRVCRGRVFLGARNCYSAAALAQIIRGLFGSDMKERRYFHAAEFLGMVKRYLPDVDIEWGSVIFLPSWCLGFASGIDEAIPSRRNPFGVFLGLSFPVSFHLRTMQEIIGAPFPIEAEGRQPAR